MPVTGPNSVLGPVTGPGDADGAPLDWSDAERATTHTLPEGTRLLDYEIVGPIGEGGFGIVYLAWDHSLEQHVAIKEYLPAILAARASVSSAVVVKSQRHRDSFRVGMRSFLNEARLLARFDHPSLVRVLHFWEDNGTAYMAMPYYEGPTLQHALAALGRPPTEEELCNWLRPLLDALGTMHAASCFHRDIAPDNILLTDTGPVLLDFGAARRVIDGMGSSPTVVFKPGFAPIEQYGEVASMRQGAWTDLYALAGVVYAAVTGHPPMPAIERLMDDRLQPLSELARDRYSEPFLAAIDAALALHPRNRPQSAAEFWTLLSCGEQLQDLELVRAVRRGDAMSTPPSTGAKVVTDRPSFAEADPVAARQLADAVRVPTMPPTAVEHVEPAPHEIEEREEPVVIRTRSRAPVSNWPPLVGARAPAQQRTKWVKPSVLAVLAVLAAAAAFVYYRGGQGWSSLGDPSSSVNAPAPPPSKPRAVTMRVAPTSTPTPARPETAKAAAPSPSPQPAPTPIVVVPPVPRTEPAAMAIPSIELPVLRPPAEPVKRVESLAAPAPAKAAEPAAIEAPAASAEPGPVATAPPAVTPAPRATTRARSEPRRVARREQRAAAPEVEPEPEPAVRAVAVPVAPLPPSDNLRMNTSCTEILQRASLGSLTPAEAAQLRKGCE